MLPFWILIVSGAIVAALLFGVWRIWRVEILVHLIPPSVIEKDAADLVAKHGAREAERAAINLSIQAWQRHNQVDAGKWDRVAHVIAKLQKKGT